MSDRLGSTPRNREPAPALAPTTVALAGALFFCSGAAGLVYEILWFRLLLLKLGGTGLAVATVTSAFMAGLGLGAWLFGTRLALRVPPLRLYGFLEIAIGLYALAVPSLIGLAGSVDVALLGVEPGTFGRSLRFFFAGVVFLPPTVCMGGTLPILSRLLQEEEAKAGWFVGLLYGLNTIGAVLGAGLCGFYLLPTLGLTRTVFAAAGLNLALGITALLAAPRRAEAAVRPRRFEAPGGETTDLARPWLAVFAAAASGLASFILQVSWTRILTLVFGSSVYAFSLILVIFLLGLGSGALAGAFVSERVRSSRISAAWCFVFVGASALLGQGWYGLLPSLYLDAIEASGGRHSLGGAAWMAGILMLPPTLLLGASFPFVVHLATGNRGSEASTGVGRLYAANTAGCVVGAWSAAIWLIPVLGLPGAVGLASGIALATGAVLAFARDEERRATSWLTRGALAPGAVGATALAVWFVAVPAWDRNLMTAGVALWGPRAHAHGRDLRRDLQSLLTDRVLFYADGVTATVAVKEASVGGAGTHRYMTIDGHIEASTGSDMPTQVLCAHVPLLVGRRRDGDVLVVGHASGVTVGSSLTHPIRSMTVVEIEEEVRDASRFFDSVNGRPLEDSRTSFVADDARAYLARTDRRFDVIISEPSSVWFSGPAKLFTLENFELVRRCLRPGGVLGQWLSTYDLTPEDILTVLRTVRAVFPHVAVFRLLAGADLLVVASDEPIGFEMQALEATLSKPAVREDLARIGLGGSCGILDRAAAEPAALAAAIGSGPINTDDNALLEYRGALSVGTSGEQGAIETIARQALGPAAFLVGPDRSAQEDDLGTLAAECLKQGAAVAARSLARRALGERPSAKAFWVLGDLARSEGSGDEALSRLTEALQLDPDHVPSLVSMALTLQQRDRLGEALERWNHALRIVPGDATILVFRAMARLHSADAAGALDDLRDARRRGGQLPASLSVDLQEARALQELGREDEALPLLERQLASIPAPSVGSLEHVATLERLARALARSRGQDSRARALAGEAAAGRSALVGPALSTTSRLLVEGGAPAARAYLRELVGMDPGLLAELRRGAVSSGDSVKIAALLDTLTPR